METHKNQYTIKWFIRKFEAIPEVKWCIESYSGPDGQHCALGHSGMLGGNRKASNEAHALVGLLGSLQVHKINDGTEGYASLGSTPKQRILNALYAKLREGCALK